MRVRAVGVAPPVGLDGPVVPVIHVEDDVGAAVVAPVRGERGAVAPLSRLGRGVTAGEDLGRGAREGVRPGARLIDGTGVVVADLDDHVGIGAVVGAGVGVPPDEARDRAHRAAHHARGVDVLDADGDDPPREGQLDPARGIEDLEVGRGEDTLEDAGARLVPLRLAVGRGVGRVLVGVRRERLVDLVVGRGVGVVLGDEVDRNPLVEHVLRAVGQGGGEGDLDVARALPVAEGGAEGEGVAVRGAADGARDVAADGGVVDPEARVGVEGRGEHRLREGRHDVGAAVHIRAPVQGDVRRVDGLDLHDARLGVVLQVLVERGEGRDEGLEVGGAVLRLDGLRRVGVDAGDRDLEGGVVEEAVGVAEVRGIETARGVEEDAGASAGRRRRWGRTRSPRTGRRCPSPR